MDFLCLIVIIWLLPCQEAREMAPAVMIRGEHEEGWSASTSASAMRHAVGTLASPFGGQPAPPVGLIATPSNHELAAAAVVASLSEDPITIVDSASWRVLTSNEAFDKEFGKTAGRMLSELIDTSQLVMLPRHPCTCRAAEHTNSDQYTVSLRKGGSTVHWIALSVVRCATARPVNALPFNAYRAGAIATNQRPTTPEPPGIVQAAAGAGTAEATRLPTACPKPQVAAASSTSKQVVASKKGSVFVGPIQLMHRWDAWCPRCVVSPADDSQWLASTTHTMRTHLCGIIGMSQLLQSTRLSPEQGLYTHDMCTSARVLLDHLSDVYDRLEASSTPALGAGDKADVLHTYWLRQVPPHTHTHAPPPPPPPSPPGQRIEQAATATTNRRPLTADHLPVHRGGSQGHWRSDGTAGRLCDGGLLLPLA